MDEKIKSKLEALLKSDAERTTQAKEKRNLEEEARAEFLQNFLQKRTEVIEPSFNEFAEFLRGHGWSTHIERDEDNVQTDGKVVTSAAATISFSRGTTPRYGAKHNTPHFSMRCDKSGKKVQLHTSTIGPNHGGSSGGDGQVDLSSITAEFVHTKLASYFEKLLRDAPAR